METQSNDKDCLQSQDFMEQEIPLEDRDRGINETLCLGLQGVHRWTDKYVNNTKNSTKCAEGESSIGQGSIFQPCGGFSIHKRNYKVQHQVKCTESPYSIVDNPWELRDSKVAHGPVRFNPLERDQCRMTAHLPPTISAREPHLWKIKDWFLYTVEKH